MNVSPMLIEARHRQRDVAVNALHIFMAFTEVLLVDPGKPFQFQHLRFEVLTFFAPLAIHQVDCVSLACRLA